MMPTILTAPHTVHIYRGGLIGCLITLGIINALRPLNDVSPGLYYAGSAVALFVSTVVISYLNKVQLL